MFRHEYKGPSAGITMTTALLSLALNQPIDPNIAMTGELTVTGKVIQIGGLKEKVIAAKRAQVTKILFPKDNVADWEELEDYIKKDLKGVPVDNYEDVFKAVFGDIDRDRAENVWTKQLEKPAKEKDRQDD
jgi:Lon-like ATP-dependent protease